MRNHNQDASKDVRKDAGNCFYYKAAYQSLGVDIKTVDFFDYPFITRLRRFGKSEVAFVPEASDFEDCLLAACAKSNKCDAIVTRNKNDFSSFGITLLSPDELLEKIA